MIIVEDATRGSLRMMEAQRVWDIIRPRIDAGLLALVMCVRVNCAAHQIKTIF